MNSVIYNPLQEFENKYRDFHAGKTDAFFEELVKKSGVDIEQNRKTVGQYNEYKENIKDLKKKLTLFKVLRVLMCITVILIPLVIWKTTPKIKDLRVEIEEADKKADELLELAYTQMLSLNNLFGDRDALNLIEETIPLVKFADNFSVEQELEMKTNYDFVDDSETEQSSLEVLAGEYNGNPFLFENRLIHEMGTETYHGYKTIHWTETYRDSNGKIQTRTRSETLHATVTKPKPFYKTQVVLHYGAQGGQDLCFSRDATNVEFKNEKEIEKCVKKGEKKLKRMTDDAIKNNSDFMSMSNTEFEVLFDALNRTNEVQFRTLFTPLAQTNMVDIILSKIGYGDDFNFIKTKRMNKIVSQHSQQRVINLKPIDYKSYSFDVIKDNFTNKNKEFFKAVYFDFAPLLSIPVYQERPVQSLKPLPDYSQLYSYKECEVLANRVDRTLVVHPSTKTEAILKSKFVRSKNNIDENCITAYSYDIEKRIDYVTMHGGDGRFHEVPVEWNDYLPLENDKILYVADKSLLEHRSYMAEKNGLCIFDL